MLHAVVRLLHLPGLQVRWNEVRFLLPSCTGQGGDISLPVGDTADTRRIRVMSLFDRTSGCSSARLTPPFKSVITAQNYSNNDCRRSRGRFHSWSKQCLYLSLGHETFTPCLCSISADSNKLRSYVTRKGAEKEPHRIFRHPSPKLLAGRGPDLPYVVRVAVQSGLGTISLTSGIREFDCPMKSP